MESSEARERPASPERARRARTGVLWAVALAMALAAAGVAHTTGVLSHRALMPDLTAGWLVLAGGFTLTAAYAFHLHFRAETHTLTLDEIVLVLGFFVVAPAQLLGAQLLGALIVFTIVRRLPVLKVCFNLAQLSLGTVLAMWIFRSVVDARNPLGERSWLAALLACVAASIVATVAIAAAIMISEGRDHVGDVAVSIVLGTAGSVVNTMLGLVIVIVLSESAFGWALLAGPIVVVFYAYRAYLSERSKSAGLEFLYSASEVLNSARDLEAGLIGLLDFARDSFHAEVAEIVVRGEVGECVDYSTGVGPGIVSRPLSVVDGSEVRAVLDAAASATEAVVVPPADAAHVVRHKGFESGSALLAPLTDDAGLRGAVLVARGRAGEPFGKEDRRLFETFANHLGTTLEKARLNTSLTQLREAKQELAYQAYHDSLTGLANRALFGERVGEALVRARESGTPVAVLFIDLDDFKTVNDTMGHAAGDALLQEVSRRIAASVNPEDTAARLGGDEFAVLLPHAAHELDARVVAERILVKLGDPIELDGQRVVMQASIGIASQDGSTSADELMQHADVAMYTAKRNGKGRFDEFEPTMSLTVAHRHQLKMGLERALAGNEFVVHYQPVIDVTTGELSALEALLRWKDPVRGLQSPTEFVGVAEETGLIVPIGRFVLMEACRQAAEWSAVRPDLRLFVNLSTRQIEDADIVGDVCTALAESGLRPDRLQLEVTETAMLHDIEQAAAVLHALKSIGVGVAIDDFGTGFSSLSYLRQLPIDMLKIAKPIVDAICESENDAAFVKGIVELGHVVGLRVVAEGVEQVEQYARLVDMGCDFVQGFYYASSLDRAEVTLILSSVATVPEEARLLRTAS